MFFVLVIVQPGGVGCLGWFCWLLLAMGENVEEVDDDGKNAPKNVAGCVTR